MRGIRRMNKNRHYHKHVMTPMSKDCQPLPTSGWCVIAIYTGNDMVIVGVRGGDCWKFYAVRTEWKFY